MKIGILGTGMVGRAHAAKLADLGHDVVIGTRDVSRTLAATEPDRRSGLPFSEWLAGRERVTLASFAEAADAGEMVINALFGDACVPVLSKLGRELHGKLLVDISNPLTFGGPAPTLTVSNTDSLAEQIQRALPETRVVKALNTVTAALQVNPGMLAEGEHDAFVSGDDPAAKDTLVGLLEEWYGWKHIIDLGDITTARGAEMYLPLWIRLWKALGVSAFSIRVVM